jgi:hypothetical protein
MGARSGLRINSSLLIIPQSPALDHGGAIALE